MPTESSRELDLVATTPARGGCGCGGCGCGGHNQVADASETAAVRAPAADGQTDLATQSYAVSGMTCGHCAGPVSAELAALDGVTDVQVDVVAGGTSTVTVTSDRPLDVNAVTAALRAAGDYELA